MGGDLQLESILGGHEIRQEMLMETISCLVKGNKVAMEHKIER